MNDLNRVIRLNDLAGVRELLSQRPRRGDFSELEEYPLAVAVGCANHQAARLLLEAGADPNFQDEEESVIGLCLDKEMLSVLMEFGANPMLETTKDGYLAIHKIATRGDVECLRLILEPLDENDRKQLLAKVDILGYTPLIYAVKNGHYETLSVLLSYGSDVNQISHERIGVPALHVAIDARNLDAVRLLVEAGADPDLSIGLNESPRELACLMLPGALEFFPEVPPAPFKGSV